MTMKIKTKVKLFENYQIAAIAHLQNEKALKLALHRLNAGGTYIA